MIKDNSVRLGIIFFAKGLFSILANISRRDKIDKVHGIIERLLEVPVRFFHILGNRKRERKL